MPGEYILNLYCLADGVLADWVTAAANLVVEEGAAIQVASRVQGVVMS